MGDPKRKKGALKTSTAGHISITKLFTGAHPDGGIMRMSVQGVEDSTGGRIQVRNPHRARYRALGWVKPLAQHGCGGLSTIIKSGRQLL